MAAIRFMLLLNVVLIISGCFAGPPGNPTNGNGGGPPWSSSFDFDVSPCELGEAIEVNDLPELAQEFLTIYHSDDAILAVREYMLSGGMVAYGVWLESGGQLLFDEEGLLASQGGELSATLTIESLPPQTIAYLDQQFPGWEDGPFDIEGQFLYGTLFITVDIDNTVTVNFTGEGVWICEEENNGGGNGNNGDDCDDESLIPMVLPWLDDNVGNYDIDDIQCDDWCEETLLIQLELEDVTEAFYFEMDGTFLHTTLDASVIDLPAAVLIAFADLHPDYVLTDEEDDIDRMEFPDASSAFRIKFRPHLFNNGRAKLVIAEDGSILCENP